MFLDIFKQANKTYRMLKHHIELGGEEAHPIVNSKESGFVSTDMFKNYRSEYEQRINVTGSLNNPVHLNQLSAGHYVVFHVLDHPLDPNTPTSWISTVDVLESDDGIKDMTMFDIGNNRRWFQTIGSDAPKGWERVSSEKTLFAGSAKMGDTVTLTDDITKYSNVIITMTTNDKSIGTGARQYNVGTSAVISTNQYIDSHLYHFQILITVITPTTVKVIDAIEVLPDGSKVAADHCYLHKIIGEKF